MDPHEEQVVIEQCRAGVAAAWDRFFDAHYAPTSRFLFQLIPDGTPEDVEEVCQDAFLAAVRNLGSFSGRSRVQTWLFRIAANKARDFRDRRLAVKRGSGRLPVPLDAEDPVTGRRLEATSPGGSPADRVAQEETMLEVRRSLDQLGGPCQEILELRYFGDFDYDTIGSTLGLNPRTVSSRLSRCLGKLGELLRRIRLTEESSHKRV
jgi:RNA polymerase sigma-70 factor (ECF subfamily)